AVVVKFYVLSPNMRPAPEVTASKDPAVIERGRYLANHVTGCIGCHSPIHEDQPGEPIHEDKRGAGRDFGVWEGAPFRLRSRNLTPDKETGLGDWTDGEILRAMREGVGKDGRPLFPQMPYETYAAGL